MKVLFVITRRVGGVWRRVSELKECLKKLGWDVEVLSRDEDVGTGFIGSFVKLRRKVKKKTYDVLIAEDWSIALPLLGMKNLFCTFNGLSPNFPANMLQKLVYLCLGRRTIVVSNSLKEHFPKAKLIYGGVNLNAFRPKKAKRSKKFRLGFAQNRFDETYRFELVKRVVDRIKDVELVVAEGIPSEEMPDFYNSLDAFISIPDKRAGFNLCWLEAMACNIPTIGNDNGIG